MILPMAARDPRFIKTSDQSLLISFGEDISLEHHRSVVSLLHLLEQEPIGGVRNLHPAYSSLLVAFSALHLDHAQLEVTLRKYLARLDCVPPASPQKIEIPVCYDKEFGLDRDDVSAACSLTPDEVIAMHCSHEYTVYFLGFVPGFAYLGDLPAPLEVPRLQRPRRMVPRGSVAIAGRQTAVYPLPTPGGWRILGRTPLAMIRPEGEGASLLRMGDRVRFISISRQQFETMERA
jgi:inhibitor of KinA